MIHTRTILASVLVSLIAVATARGDGRNPGSLLVFPEFQSQNGQLTLITVSNPDTAVPATTVRVHYVYVSGDAATLCSPQDATETLTAQDTLTVVASLHQGQGFSQGYVYAYAVDALGRAISYDHLIGDQLVVDGSFALDYAVQPFSFRAIASEGMPTATDADDVLDLNDREYELAPDVILIPRFMGQSASFASELVMIGLSGGQQFTTTVDMLIFNDNEVALSAQKSFRCWTKLPLAQISGSFDAAFLANMTNDNPAEILGASAHESGWLRIQGIAATAGVTTIVDPAILAVLVERTATSAGAELPFLQGTQPRGDLLPAGIAWDGD